MARPKGESNQGLIVSLVFFILSTIILGVTTYLGYSGQDGFEQKIKDANTKASANEGDRDWYRAQTTIYKAALGRLQLKDPKQFENDRKQIIADTGLGAKAFAKDEVADVKALVVELDGTMAYEDATQKYKNNYPGLLVKEKEEAKKVRDENTNLSAKIAALEGEKAGLEKQLTQQKEDYKNLQVKLNKENNDTKNTQDKNRSDLEAKVKDLAEQNAAILTTAAEEKKKLLADLKRANDTLADQKRQATALNEELLAIRSAKSETAPKAIRTDWKISTIAGNSPYINLGSADNVRPQLTFTVHGLTPDGRVIPTPKGTVEVVNVIDTKLSKVRVTSVKDPNRDPILAGDIIANSTWDPFQKRRIALAGYMDIYGDGRDAMVELRRILERQNVQIDAVLDLKTFTIQGAVTLQTEFLVMGDGPESLSVAIRDRDDFGKKLSKGIDDIQAEAKRNGVPVIGLRKYLDSIGFKVPRPVGDR